MVQHPRDHERRVRLGIDVFGTSWNNTDDSSRISCGSGMFIECIIRSRSSRDNGNSGTWSTIATNVSNSGNTSGTFSWIVSGPATSTARIRITSVSNGAATDVSNVNFRIQ